MSLYQEVHDRLWQAFQRWEQLRLEGGDKHELKMRGLREAGDIWRYTRNLIFSPDTMRTYEDDLRKFVDYAAKHHGVTTVSQLGRREFRSFMDHLIEKGHAPSKLNQFRSALAKLGALIGKSESFRWLSAKYGKKIRQLVKDGVLKEASQETPSPEVFKRTIQILKQWDARHFARTGECRGYHLAARVQDETGGRAISGTDRLTEECLGPGNSLIIIGKAGQRQVLQISPELHRILGLYFRHNPGPLARKNPYRSAFRRAVLAAGGRVTGTHGARRRSTQDFRSHAYQVYRKEGLSPKEASDRAIGDAIERLGHSRNRADHRKRYLSA